MKLKPSRKADSSTKVGQKLTGVVPRLTATWRLFWQQRGKFVLLAAVVAVPSTLVRSASAVTMDFSIVLFVAGLYTVLALIYFCHHLSTATKQSIAVIYTRASGRFLQMLGVTLLQALALLPAIFAVALLVFVSSFDMAKLLYIPGFLLLFFAILGAVGLSMAQFIAASEDASVIGALRASWVRTRGLKLRLLGHYGLFGFIVAMVSGVVFFVVNISSVLATSWFVQGVVSSVLLVIILPWLVTYGYSIYDETAQQ